jgi:hypothetical protein
MEYLVCYPRFKLEYSKKSCNSMGLDGFCYSDWVTSDTRRSTTGTIYRYNGAPIKGKTKVKKTISLSTAEAEYYGVSTTAVESTHLRLLLRGMGFLPEGYKPVFEDNNACIEWSNNIIGGRERAKHINIRKHVAHEAIQKGHVRLIRVSTASLHQESPAAPSRCGPLRHPLQTEDRNRRQDARGEIWIYPMRANRTTSILTRGVS